MVEAWLFLALGTTLAWGVGAVAAKRGVIAFGPRRMVIVVALGEVPVFLAAFLASGSDLALDATGVILGFTAGLTGMLGYVVYYEAIARGTISRVGTVIAAYPAATAVLAVILLQEAIGPVQALGVLLLVGSAVLLGYQEERETTRGSRPVTFLVVLAFLLWALWGLLVKVAVTAIGQGPMFLFFALSNGSVALVLLLLSSRSDRSGVEGRVSPWWWPVLTMILGSAGVILLTLALVDGPAALVAPVTAAYPVVTVLVAVPLLQERIGRAEVLAFAAFALGLFAVAAV